MGRKSSYVDLKKTVVLDSKGRRITDDYIEKSLKRSVLTKPSGDILLIFIPIKIKKFIFK